MYCPFFNLAGQGLIFLHTHNYVILAERVYNVVARGSQTEGNFVINLSIGLVSLVA